MNKSNRFTATPSTSTVSSTKLSNLIQQIHQAGRNHTNPCQLPQLNQSREDIKKKYNNLFRSYQEEKKAIEAGLLTPSHLNKYLKPKKKHVNLRNEVQFLFNSRLKTQVNKLRAANFILNVKQNSIAKNEIIQSTININDKGAEKAEFLTKIQQIFIKQRTRQLDLIKSAPIIVVKDHF